MTPPEPFGVVLRGMRESRDMSLPDFARKIGLTRPHAWQLEHGLRTPSSLSRLQLARTALELTNLEFAHLVYSAARDHALGLRTEDFTKARDVFTLIALLATHDRRIPRDFFTRAIAWIEQHCVPPPSGGVPPPLGGLPPRGDTH